MTSTTDTAEHPEITEISELAEGLLPPTRTTDVQQHLDGCALCADVLASLEEIRGTLGAVSDPPRMPEEIASRIDAALAFEGGREPGPVSRETSAAADRPAGHPHGATGPGRKARGNRRRTGAVLGAVLTVTAIGVGALLIQNDEGGSPVARKSPSASTFAKDTLETKVTNLLGSSTISTEEEGPSAQGTKKAPMQKRAVSVPPCIQLGTHRNEDPLAAETGTYEGKKAYLVVLPHKSDPAHRVTAFVVDSSCVDSSSSAGTLLYKHDYDHGSGVLKNTR
ncbi:MULTISPECIES: hypothetical protein [unclassified Streptomyces]|uniref:anti-sigma factor family protein n=1 Tax=unclassified Streptomyces TaxID=2593676 RepID=UPI002E16D082|nr:MULTISPECIES: hypothetical protein [unclassified Streptomyces]